MNIPSLRRVSDPVRHYFTDITTEVGTYRQKAGLKWVCYQSALLSCIVSALVFGVLAMDLYGLCISWIMHYQIGNIALTMFVGACAGALGVVIWYHIHRVIAWGGLALHRIFLLLSIGATLVLCGVATFFAVIAIGGREAPNFFAGIVLGIVLVGIMLKCAIRSSSAIEGIARMEHVEATERLLQKCNFQVSLNGEHIPADHIHLTQQGDNIIISVREPE